MPDDTRNDSTPAPGSRSRRRRNVFGASPHRDEYVRMLEAGWSSLAVERYAWHRFGEDIPASTIRTYKTRHGIESRAAAFQNVSPDEFVDVLSARAELIRLQQQRIQVDWAHEQKMTKLFANNRAEIGLLNTLLTEHKNDLQDLGLMPKAGVTVEHHHSVPVPETGGPRYRSLAEALGQDLSEETQARIGQVLHLSLVSGNGHKAASGE